MPRKLRDDAIFIADAHYQVGIREALYDFLLALQRKEIETSQLIMMGDMFDLLVGGIDYTTTQNKKVIDLINTLSHTIEILYFEGNHDFHLHKLFPNVLVIPITQQPLICHYHNKKIALSHGDLYQSLAYHYYTSWIRHPYTLKLLNFIDKKGDHFISKTILQKQKKKNICKKIDDFSQIIKQKSKKYDIAHNRFDLICEGHYHMDEDFTFGNCHFKIFASYACGNIYFRWHFKDRIVFIPNKG